MGIVYVMSNPSLPNVVKIGKTRNIGNRRKQLSGTSTPFEFKVDFQLETEKHDLLEKLAQKSLGRFRVNKRREFFQTDVATAKRRILEIAEHIESGLEYLPMSPISDSELDFLESQWCGEYDYH